ncbi:MAG TPA: hypothetical protein PLZ84_00730 [Clostridia bacterium]|nr:hypothetical protein [Clostridia bacterium]
MKLGKYGLSLAAVGALSFVLCFLGVIEALILVLAYCVIVEKDQYLIKQSLQALYLLIAYNLIITAIGWIFSFFIWLFKLVSAYEVVESIMNINSFVDGVIYVGLFVLSLLAVINILRGRDAGVPLINTLADATMGKVIPKAPPCSAYPAQPQWQAPAQAQQEDGWVCSCGNKNIGKFCTACGNQKSE